MIDHTTMQSLRVMFNNIQDSFDNYNAQKLYPEEWPDTTLKEWEDEFRIDKNRLLTYLQLI